MSILPVAVSLILSFESAIMMLGYPAEVYVYGVQYWINTLAHLLIHLPVAVLSVSLFHPLHITSVYEVIPYTVMDIFQSLPGMPGLFLAALFSASFSTLSTGLSSISAMVLTDFIKPRAGHVSELTATLIAMIIVVVAGVITCGVALLVSLASGPLNQTSHSLLPVFSCTGLFVLACLCPWANAKGGIVGTVVASILTGWIAFGQSFSKSVHKTPWLPPAAMDKCLANHSLSLLNVTSAGHDVVYHTMTNNADFVPEAHGVDRLYTLSYEWLGALNILTSVILGAFVSWCTGGNKEGAADSRYLLPVCDVVCCCLPESVRRYCRCAECLPPAQTEETPAHSYPCNQEMESRREKDVTLCMPKRPEKNNSTKTDTEADL